MKTAIVFLVVITLFFAAIYVYYWTIGGTPIEERVNEALNIRAEKEGVDGLPIVVSLGPFSAIIVFLITMGVLLELNKEKTRVEMLAR